MLRLTWAVDADGSWDDKRYLGVTWDAAWTSIRCVYCPVINIYPVLALTHPNPHRSLLQSERICPLPHSASWDEAWKRDWFLYVSSKLGEGFFADAAISLGKGITTDGVWFGWEGDDMGLAGLVEGYEWLALSRGEGFVDGCDGPFYTCWGDLWYSSCLCRRQDWGCPLWFNFETLVAREVCWKIWEFVCFILAIGW